METQPWSALFKYFSMIAQNNTQTVKLGSLVIQFQPH